ncbi:hypothetical protein [Caballeronia grimmiae]|uniref:Uncharacterized protein n=1 Tax=Caballeronia grimmiae TaxID=1071679 RepID=A0A069NC89_9BURK|nr:hypothetical protein [Caballeronia grimmiae]KDR25264.1 hypothetical protein BG57_31740 [Caballeronia grimmiae]GGD88131.1 hypothetical protein GCM10010985_48330 [Caballeronia grimmiae]
MIKDEQYGHLRPLNDFRKYLLAIQWDMSLRELEGRSLSDAGYTRIQADPACSSPAAKRICR